MPVDVFRGPPQLQEWQRQAIGQLPLFIGPAYNALRAGNQIVKWGQQLFGGLPANQALNGNDPDYNQPNYIGLGDPAGTPDYSSPAAPGPAQNQSGPRPAPATQGYNTQGMLSFWNKAFPGSALGQFAPTANPYNPNAPSVTGKSGSNSGMLGASQVLMNQLRRMQQ